jgi:TerC family integral membrane protein
MRSEADALLRTDDALLPTETNGHGLEEVDLSPERFTARKRRVQAADGQGLDMLAPMESWYAAPPPVPRLRRGAALSLPADDALLDSSGRHGGAQYRRAIVATIWSFVATAAFALLVLLPWRGSADTLDFVTGFLVEKSLSVDNLFVFLMLFRYFKVPERHTERVLRWGIISALVLRGVMIAVGVAAVQRFRPVLLVFALILVVSAYKMLQPEAEEEELSENMVMRAARSLVRATDRYDGDRFFTTVGGARRATPMLVVLVCIELSDVLFAVDSIPAVVGITQDPFIVYTSNIFALLALRSLYLLLSRSARRRALFMHPCGPFGPRPGMLLTPRRRLLQVQQLHYLRHAVAAILGFVGVKMVLEYLHYGISSAASLSVILTLLLVGTAASLHRNKRRHGAWLMNGGGAELRSAV